MQHSPIPRVSRLAIKMATISFAAFGLLACVGEAKIESEEVAVEPHAVTPVLPKAATAPAKAVAPAPDVKASAKQEAPDPAKKAEEAPRKQKDAKAGELSVKRFTVTQKVEDREPLALNDPPRVGEPVMAFVELANSSVDETEVVVTFEHPDGDKVGFVELGVPGESRRYRTWGQTRNIKKPGTWTAVVSTKDGVELARQEFPVSAS